MGVKQAGPQAQQDFLRDAMSNLGMTRSAFAKRISVPDKTLEKWLAPADTSDFRAMPEVVWAYVREILLWTAKSS